ncbi:MAG: NAD(P)-binding domain-containing protein [Candidatus Paceibacterota bacterium]|jgi:nucleotide sugar dehydrogenase
MHKIGFIGQGWIGKNYADDFENRGFAVVRYSLEPEYIENKKKIKDCEFVFIAVPTPTKQTGFDMSYLHAVLPLVGKGKVAIIKSTIIPGSTKKLAKEFTHCTVFHSPEFLVEKTAAQNASHPDRNIIGVPVWDDKHKKIANEILNILPKAAYELICTAEEAEIIKYAHNIHGVMQVVFANTLFDLGTAHKADWERIKSAISADPYMCDKYLNPVHKSGRGAGGDCFVKDFEAFIESYSKSLNDNIGKKVFEAIRDKNISLLRGSQKDLDKIKAVYGE